MSAEVKKEIQLEIAHVLFSDIVGYSKLLINEQRALRDTLNQIVRETEEFQTADTNGKLIKIPTGDGMALVFSQSPEAPAECALEISRALKGHPSCTCAWVCTAGRSAASSMSTGKRAWPAQGLTWRNG
jgi:hypothetical protein